MPVKKSLLLFIFSYSIIVASAQIKMSDYSAVWKKIDSLTEKSGQTKTALIAVNNLYARAKKENNETQVIKALIYRINLGDQLTDNDQPLAFSTLEKEIAEAKEPSKAILQSILATAYLNYLQNNRYRFYNRSATTNYRKNDPATWTIDDLHKQIARLFLSSLFNEELLKSTTLKSYDALLIKGNSRTLRPTLYDLLAHRALDYFQNDERTVTKPAYAFEITDEAAFADARQFSAHHFQTADSTALHYQALLIFQKLIDLHLSQHRPEAVADADIERLTFVNNHSTAENKERLYKTSLERITKTYSSTSASSQAIYLLAEWYASKGVTYDPLKDTTFRLAYITAKELCEKGLFQKEPGEGRSNCANLLNQITKKQLKTQIEKVNLPGEPFRILVTYKNIPAAYFRIIKVDPDLKDKLGRETWTDEYWQKLTLLPAIGQFSSDLPATGDYQQHRVEVKGEALEPGQYAILSASSKEFDLKHNALALQYIHVSGIAYVNSGNKYYVLNRNTGVPLAGATVQIWNKQYNYQKKKEQRIKGKKYTTDNNGFFRLADTTQAENNYSTLLDITYGKDKLYDDQEIYTYTYHPADQTADQKPQAFLFSDRSIYRPGQLIYFKAIVSGWNKTSATPEILSGLRSVVTLYNANNEAVDSLKVTTNDYGSYTGTFTLPTGILNGSFYIQDQKTGGMNRFRVEEYKRPKFAVEIKKPAGTYRLGDTIQVTGTAKSFAGNNIDGASVTYRVTRKRNIPYYPFTSYSKIWPPYQEGSTEITHGSTTTDAQGTFLIVFSATADNSIPADQNPVFNYEITADITDINGETRSGINYIAVGAKALNIEINTGGPMHTDSLKAVKIFTSNMNALFEKTLITVSIQKLTAPLRIARDRYWEQPDQFIMNREDYYSYFPHDQYSDENDKTKWAVEKNVFNVSVFSAADSMVPVTVKNLQPGWYAIQVTGKDKFNKEVKEISYLELYNEKTVSPGVVAAIEMNAGTAQPGDRVRYHLRTNLKNVYQVQEVVSASGEKRITGLLPEISLPLDIIVSKADQGSIAVNCFFVKNNRVYSDQRVIAIPYFDKQLQINYTTFRDRTLPGAKEKWNIKISGLKGEKKAAELLTSMYDASLDQFAPHSWTVPALWFKNIDITGWEGRTNFIQNQSVENQIKEEVEEGREKSYDALLYLNESRIVYAREEMNDMAIQQMSVKGASMAKAAPRQKEEEADKEEPEKTQTPLIQPRKNGKETAFFFPELHTDAAGAIEFSFTSPEALSTWKWMLMAHTKDLAFGYGQKTMITQKELMVQPNAPRFLRAGDRVVFSSKIVNLTGNTISGKISLQLTDALTGKNADALFNHTTTEKTFTVAGSQSTAAFFTIDVPVSLTTPVTWRIMATSASLSDGEEAILPVISNRMLVTESLPLPAQTNIPARFSFDKLLNSGISKSLQQKGITIEFTSNPAWYAVQALPYLAEGVKENAEQLFNRYYANALAYKIAGSSPRFKEIIEKWRSADTSALTGNLQKNEALKSILLQESPWLLEAKTETQQKKLITTLFDTLRLHAELSAALNQLKELQSPAGGFVWVKGGPEDRYMTQYILSGIGHLKKLGALPANQQLHLIIKAAIVYLDNQIKKEYEQLKKTNLPLPENTFTNISAHYLYTRSFFMDIDVAGQNFAAYNYYRNQSKINWVKQNTYTRGMIALALSRTGDIQNAQKIMRALKESAIINKETGMYWKDMSGGYYWYQAPVETQSLAIEAFSELMNDNDIINKLKTWLIKNKQTSSWKTSKATADACYALLLQGKEWTSEVPDVRIQLGSTAIGSDEQAEAGTGYFKKYIDGKQVTPSMGTIRLNVSSPSKNSLPVWGSVYWQYFEDLDKITPASTPMVLNKKLFIQKNSDRGPLLEPLEANDSLQVGDKVKVRIELRSDRAMEYVHLKDMRASCLEPVNTVSEYKWQDGLGYFESTKDASTDFFFNTLPKGVFVFEYSLFVTAAGTYNNGITTIQCLYAPEFSSHSEGIKLISVLK